MITCGIEQYRNTERRIHGHYTTMLVLIQNHTVNKFIRQRTGRELKGSQSPLRNDASIIPTYWIFGVPQAGRGIYK